jgi:hypothetical protein
MDRRAAAAVFGLIVLAGPVRAIFVQPELENVPIDRLVANLERLAREDPADIPVRLNLARVHAMAYAYKTNTAQVAKGRERAGAFTGFEPVHTQFAVKTAPDAASERIAREHLTKAIVRYRETVALARPVTGQQGFPGRLDLTAQLGLGWCLAQAGERDSAIAALRIVADQAWPNDLTNPKVMQRQRSLTEEAVRYLVPLLDPQKDKEEIALLQNRASQLARTLRPVTPVAVPLRAGLDALDITSGDVEVLFDADGSGLARRWTWITPDSGWLVFDRRGTRQIDSALQMFGSVTFWLFWENGYRALRALDDNGDRQLTDHELDSLAIWHDRNVNGRSDAGEVRLLSDWQIVALSCDYEIDPTHPDEIAYSPAGVTFRDGSSRPTFDIILHPAGRAAQGQPRQ